MPVAKDHSPHHTADELNDLLGKKVADISPAQVLFLADAIRRGGTGQTLAELFGYTESRPAKPVEQMAPKATPTPPTQQPTNDGKASGTAPANAAGPTGTPQ